MPFFEVREYTMRRGREADWVRLMDQRIIPLVTRQGMVVVGSFVDEADPSHYIWISRFDSDEQREELYRLSYVDNAEWTGELAPLVPEMVDRSAIKVWRMNPTQRSVLR